MTNSRSYYMYSDPGPSSIEVIRSQELSKEYQCCDYLSNNTVVTAATRREMLDWVSKVAKFMKIHEEIPILTATLLDRFLQTTAGQQILTSIPNYRLATMGCLYLMAKVHDPCVVVSPTVMSAFSQGMFSEVQVEEMELTILQAMKWRANPPTALAFVREFLLLLPCSVSTTKKEQAYEHCRIQIQRCMLDYEVFALIEASTIAFFAVQNALRSLGMDSITLGHVAAIFSYATHTDFYSETDTDTEVLVQTSLLGQGSTATSANSSTKERSSKRRGSKKSRRSSLGSSSSKSSSLRSIAYDESPSGVVAEARRTPFKLRF